MTPPPSPQSSPVRTIVALVAGACALTVWGGGTAALAQMHEPPQVTLIPPPAGPATAVAPVTVEAKRLTRPEVEKQSLRFVQTYATPTAKLDQIARWREPVCIEVTALDPVDAARIMERIRQVARTLGVNVLRTGCRANIEMVFAARPQHWLDWVGEHRDAILGYHYVADAAVLKTVTRPIQAWYETATRSDAMADAGLAMGVISGAGAIAGGSNKNETIDSPDGDSPSGCGDSRFTSCLQSVFKNVLVFVDTSRLKGQDLGPAADYLAMLVLSQPRSLDGCTAFASVIDLLAPNCPGRPAPEGLTPADTAYLKALYGADLEARRASEESDIAGRMASILIKTDEKAR